MQKKKILFVFRHSPYGNIIAKESIDSALAASVYDQDISILFFGDGVFQLAPEQQPKTQKNIEQILSAFSLYDIDQLFACDISLQERHLPLDKQSNNIQRISKEAIQELMASQDAILSF